MEAAAPPQHSLRPPALILNTTSSSSSQGGGRRSASPSPRHSGKTTPTNSVAKRLTPREFKREQQ